ncbi:MAG: hypothetical protein LBB14_03430 [Puniceicoccales bacterium]|nr:hypothetical protein [Puniceicoccales bacterium]
MDGGAQFLYGDDGTLVQRRAEEIIEGKLRRSPDCQLEVFIGRPSSLPEFQKFADLLSDALATLPLFSSEKCIWVKSIAFLAEPLAEESVALLEQLAGQLARAKEFGLTVVLSASPVDRRLRPFKLLKSHCQSVEVEGNGRDAAEIALDHGAEALGLSFDFSARRTFLAKVGPDAAPVNSELEKLAAYLSGRREVTADAVREIAYEMPREDFFEPIEAFYRRDISNFAIALRHFLGADGEPRALLSAMQSKNRSLLQLKAAQMSGAWNVSCGRIPSRATLERARSLRTVPLLEGTDDVFSLNPWYLGRLSECLALFDLAELVRLQGALLDIFEFLTMEWQDLSVERLLDKFLSLCGCLRDSPFVGSSPRHG